MWRAKKIIEKNPEKSGNRFVLKSIYHILGGLSNHETDDDQKLQNKIV